MARRWLFGGGIALGAALVGLMLGLPGYRLNREIAAARREGLWTDWTDVQRHASGVPAAENSAPLIRKAIALERRGGWDEAARRLLKGTATPAEIALVRREIAAHPEIAAAWRLASARPRVDYGRPWREGAGVLFMEYPAIKRGVRRLVVAARLGQRPKENLLAAARLANLTRQEPVIIASLVSVSLGRMALREARRQGFAREVDAALGPPLDVRHAYAAEPAFALDVMQNDGTEDWYRRMGLRHTPSLWVRLTHVAPRRANETAAVVRDWRLLWRDMGSGTDYPAAARAMRRWDPGINDRLANWSEIYAKFADDSEDAAFAVEAFAKYAAERKASVRAGGFGGVRPSGLGERP